MKKISVVFLFIIVIIVGFFLYYREGSLPVNKYNNSSKIFVIEKGEGLSSIANRLGQEGLIRNKIIFYLVVKQLGLERKIQAGDFRLSPSFDIYEIAKTLTHGTLDVWITIIEGMRKEEVAQIISKNLNIPESEFLKYAKEGYLFPDTYLIPKDATAESVIQILEANFNRKLSEELKKKARERVLTVDQVVILASLVEREAKFDEDRKKVASVLLKRLDERMKLDIDATVQYVLGYQPNEKQWWKRELTLTDLDVTSLYNTYRNAGLPPGPIASPGLASIVAVVNGDKNTPHLYYVSDSTGRLHFARTLEEHNENIRKYLQ